MAMPLGLSKSVKIISIVGGICVGASFIWMGAILQPTRPKRMMLMGTPAGLWLFTLIWLVPQK